MAHTLKIYSWVYDIANYRHGRSNVHGASAVPLNLTITLVLSPFKFQELGRYNLRFVRSGIPLGFISYAHLTVGLAIDFMVKHVSDL